VIGSQCFFEGNDDSTKLFGLSLLRESLCWQRIVSQPRDDVAVVRQSFLAFLDQALQSQNFSLPTYLLNNILTILALCLKREYPDTWPNAFPEIVALSQKNGIRSAEILLGVLQEFEIEVVAFNEMRSTEENQNNTMIKDTMRHTNIPQLLIKTLCGHFYEVANVINQQQSQTPSFYIEVGKKALICISELISWVDINLILNEAWAVIVTAIEKFELSLFCVPGLLCIKELLKKGMDTISRTDIIHSIQLHSILKNLMTRLFATDNNNNKLEKFRNDYDENLYQLHYQVGLILDLIMIEFYTFWMKFEEYSFPIQIGNSTSSSSQNSAMNSVHQSPEIPLIRKTLATVSYSSVEFPPDKCKEKSPLVASNIHSFLPLILQFLSHPCITLALSMSSSLNKFVQILKLQKNRFDQYQQNYFQLMQASDYFISYTYLDSFLSILLKQSYYPINFDFTIEDDDDMQEFIEVSDLIHC
jgi:hypothetical protein